MLKHRLLMSALLIPATIGLFVWDHHLGPHAPALFVLVMLLAARCVWELVILARSAGLRPNLVLCLLGSWMTIQAAWCPVWRWRSAWQQWTESLFTNPLFLLPAGGVVVVVMLFNAVMRFSRFELSADRDVSTPQPGRQLATLGIELFIVGYVGVLLALTVQLRWTAHPLDDVVNIGYFALSALVVATKMGDVGAYTFGRLIGGPKMTPQLSPGKTWSGGVGHLVTAGLCSVAWLCWLGPMISTHWPAWGVVSAAVFGVVVGFAGLIGDLAESLIKRDVGVKDAPALLPGFGGLLDLMDSLLLAGPVAYFMWNLLQ